MLHFHPLTFSLLWSFLSCGLAIQCNKTQYEWPSLKPTLCCDMCPPGKRYVSRSETTCEIKCESCDEDRYMDNYNLERNCNVCDVCKKANFETASVCKATHNTVCKCSAGFRYVDSYRYCEPVPTTIHPTSTQATNAGSTSTTKTTDKPSNTIRDTQWFLVIIVLLCAGIALVVVTKMKPILHWIRTKPGYFVAQKIVMVTPCPMDDGVSKPVQEVCGKCDICIDLCIKE